MPYSDPKKKRAYMAQYNKKYYAENADAIKPRSKSNKKQLRQEKYWLFSRPDGSLFLVPSDWAPSAHC